METRTLSLWWALGSTALIEPSWDGNIVDDGVSVGDIVDGFNRTILGWKHYRRRLLERDEESL